MAYIAPQPADGDQGCPFCAIPGSPSTARALIVHRGELAYAVLNLHPYNPAT